MNWNAGTYSSGRVENLHHALLAVDLDLLAVAVLDSRIVLLNEYALHKLNGQGRFTKNWKYFNEKKFEKTFSEILKFTQHHRCPTRQSCTLSFYDG